MIACYTFLISVGSSTHHSLGGAIESHGPKIKNDFSIISVRSRKLFKPRMMEGIIFSSLLPNFFFEFGMNHK